MRSTSPAWPGWMEDVPGLYEKPLPERAPVVCVDEKPVLLHADVGPLRPMRPGRIARRDGEYQRRGTANVFCGVPPKAGRHFTKPTPNRCSPQFADSLVEIVARYPEADTIHRVMDNLRSHNRKALADRFGEKMGGLLWERFTVHSTPEHGSWLNSAEIEISLFSRPCWDGRQSRRSNNDSSKQRRGTGRGTTTAFPSTGSLRAERHGRSSATTETQSYGERPMSFHPGTLRQHHTLVSRPVALLPGHRLSHRQ